MILGFRVLGFKGFRARGFAGLIFGGVGLCSGIWAVVSLGIILNLY